MKELISIDPQFNEGMFITKVNNIFIMLHSAIMMDDLNRVRHYISDDLEEKYENKLKELNSNNVRQMYDELNVKTTSIEDIIINNDNVIIKVDIVSRYMDYVIDKNTLKFVSGINDRRVEKLNHLEFMKKRDIKSKGIVTKCLNCGASLDINASGRCSYCGAIFKNEDYDWILTSIETVDV